jgi:ABC-type cobalamin/Fe3+-siderophores transport system ATPase subunit
MPELFQTGLDIRQSCLKLLGFLRKQKPNKMDGGSLRRPDLCRPIVFQRVSVTSGLTPLFKKLSFKINSGHRVGIIGVEGTGRSLLFELITKTTAADNSDDAEIRLFGLRLEDIPESVIKRDVFVLEKLPALFEGSIRDNLDPYASITDDRLYDMMLSLEFESLLIDDAEAVGGSDHEKKVVIERKVTVDEQLRCFNEVNNLNKSTRKSCKLAEDLHKRSSRGETDKKNQAKDKKLGSSMIRKMFISSFTGKQTKKTEHGFKVKNKTQDEDENPQNEIYQVYKKTPLSNGVKSNIDSGPIRKKMITLSKNRLASPLSDKRESIKTKKYAKMESIKNKPTEPANTSPIQVRIEMEPEPERLVTIKTLKKASSSQKWLGDPELIHQKTPRASHSQLNYVEVIEDISAEDDEKNQNRTKDFNSGSMRRTNRSLRKLTNQESIESRPDEPERYLHKALGMVSASLGSPSMLYDYTRARLTVFSKNRSSFTRHNQETLQKNGENEQEVERILQKIFANFLSKKVAFGGKNIDPNTRKLIIYVRAIFAKPKILLLYEEALSFGRGVSFNLQKLSAALKDSTILCITKNNMNLLFYDKVLFFDAGKIVEKGDPVALLDNESSFLYQYLAETDRVALQVLKNKRAQVEASKTMLMKTPPADKSWRGSTRGPPDAQIFEEINDPLSKKIKSIDSLEFKDSRDDLVFSRPLAAHLQTDTLELSKLVNKEFAEKPPVAVCESLEDTVEEWNHEIGEFSRFQDSKTEPDSSSLQKVQLPSSKPISMMRNLPGYICYESPAGALSVGSLPDNEGDRLEELDVVPSIREGVLQLEPNLRTIHEMSEHLEMASATLYRSEFKNDHNSPQARKYSTFGTEKFKINESAYGSAVSREQSNLQVQSKDE